MKHWRDDITLFILALERRIDVLVDGQGNTRCRRIVEEEVLPDMARDCLHCNRLQSCADEFGM